MSQPTSLRIPTDVRERLERVASRTGERGASLATRLIDEGLRMAEHPGIVFIDAGAGWSRTDGAPDVHGTGAGS